MKLLSIRSILFSAIFIVTYPLSAYAIGNGKALDGLESFDIAISTFLEKWNVPGASLAVAKDGKLLLAKGYGLADKENNLPATEQTLFRMGSINKTLTAVIVLQLAEQGKLKLEDKAVPYFQKLGLVPQSLEDPRVNDITIQHLLQHLAGFDRGKSGDHFFQPRLREVARRQKTEPVTCEAIVKDALGSKLDFTPGEKFAYSNTGYCMLGKIIEAVTGQTYADYVSQNVLQPTIGKNFVYGKSIEPLPGETKYHMYPGEQNMRGAPGVSNWSVPTPYGSYSIENMHALGAWVATPTDVLKFFLAIDGAKGRRLLTSGSFASMTAPPLIKNENRTDIYFGMGLQVVNMPGTFNWYHRGSQPGVETLALRTSKGYSWVVAFNALPQPDKRKAFFNDFDRALWKAADAVKTWPTGDLFE